MSMRLDVLLNKAGFWTLWALVGLIGCQPESTPQTAPALVALPDTVTFATDIAPLVYRHCSPCHRPSSAGPFNLLTYAEVRRKAKTIRRVVRTGYMPPWPADPSYRHFAGEKVLSEREKALIERWVNQDCPLGDSLRVPPVPAFTPGSSLGEPDLVIRMDTVLPIYGDNQDQFLFAKIPYEISQDTFVRAIEFVPGNSKVVHHMNGHLISYSPGAKADIFDGARAVDREKVPVEVAYPRLGLLNDDGTYPELTPLICNYLPGVLPQVYPPGIGGFKLARQGAILLNDLHYGPSPVDTSDQSYFNLFFAPGPPQRPTMEIQLGTLGISDIVPPLVIPPDTVMTFRTAAVIKQDISLLTVNPHMHLLGQSFKAWAIHPEGDTIPLIHIPEWDFRWQFFYSFERMLHLPAGSRIEVEARFDNTAANPNNPYDPPQMIAERNGSMRTTDEMLQFIITYLPYQAGDEEIVLGGNEGL